MFLPKIITEKLRLVYLPIVIVMLCFTAVYSGLNYMVFIRGGSPWRDTTINIFIPFLLSFLPIFIFLRPRIRLLRFDKSTGVLGLQLFVAFTFGIPIALTQEYLVIATGQLTEVDNISQLNPSLPSKYYVIRNFYLDKKRRSDYYLNRTTGRGSSKFSMEFYTVTPILPSSADTTKPLPNYWLGKKIEKTISNRQQENIKETAYQDFLTKTENSLDIPDNQSITYFETVRRSYNYDSYALALYETGIRNTDENIILEANNTPFADRYGKIPFWLVISWSGMLVAWAGLVLCFKFHHEPIKPIKPWVFPDQFRSLNKRS